MPKIMKIPFFFIPFLIWISLPARASQNYQIENTRFYSRPTYTRIVLEISGRVEYIVKDLSNPPRLLINLYPTQLVSPQQEMDIGDKFVKKVHLEQDSKHVVKVVVDLSSSPQTYNIFSLEDPCQVVIDLKSPREDLIADLLKREEPSLEEKGKIRRIVLDPGHGGEDPGAIGPTGLEEKEVTLEVAKELARLLEDELELRVYLTRLEDRFISLDRRTEIANQRRGDIFVSIHANAGFDRKAQGVETFFNSRYVYGKRAAEVAARENVPLGSDDAPSEVKVILWDLIQNQYRNESNDLAHLVQEELCKTTGMEDRGVKSARFYVLRGADMPSMLVEIGFISNPWEEIKLKRKDFRKKIARGIFRGLKYYIQSYNEKVSR